MAHPRRLLRERGLRKLGIEPKLYYSYDLPWLTGVPFDLIIDIGAAGGGHTRIFRHLFPRAEIHAFEPLPASFESLRKNLGELPRVFLHPVALSDHNGKAGFHVGREDCRDSSSLLPMSNEHHRLFPGTGIEGKLEVETRRLDDLLDGDNYRGIFIKMDVQGAENMVIEGGRRIFGAASVVIMEVSFYPLYEGESLFEDIYETMKSLGLKFTGMLKQVDDRLGDRRVIQGDAIFTRGLD